MRTRGSARHRGVSRRCRSRSRDTTARARNGRPRRPRRRRARAAQRRVRGTLRVPLLRLRRGPVAGRAAPRAGRRARGGSRCRAGPRPRRGRRHRARSLCHDDLGSIGGSVVIELAANRYGKAAIRLVRVAHGADGDRVRDLTIAIALEGDFEAAHTDGDNANVIATDTMKNTAYAFAKDHLDGAIEDYGRALRRALPRRAPGRHGDRQHPRAPLAPDRGRGPAGAGLRPRRRGDACRDGHREPRRDDGRSRRRGPHRDEDDDARRSAASRATATRRCPRPTTG